MDELISEEANHQFSRRLRGVRKGRTYLITSHGEPIARMVPAPRDRVTADAAFSVLMDHLKLQPAVDGGRWTRDELYEDGV